MVTSLRAYVASGLSTRWARIAALVLALGTAPASARADTVTIEEGAVLKITRDAVLNGVSLPKGTELKIAAIKKDNAGENNRFDLQRMDGDKKIFKAITLEALTALTAASGAGSSGADRTAVFKVAAQIPIVRELSLGGVVFQRGSTLQIDKVEKDKTGRPAKLDLRETSGAKRLMRGVTVEQLLAALSPDDVTWPDGSVGRTLQLGAEFKFGGVVFPKATRFVVTRVETEPKKGEVVRVDLREIEGEKRELASVPVAILKQNGALGTAEGAAK
ncbi:MAG TPA: hypothetical protein VK540_35460 [Polyangiaceae bacterium]|nr:hypothetical protein [Polyangiaceae bacterium]